MKKAWLRKTIALTSACMMTMGLMAGCGSSTDDSAGADTQDTTTDAAADTTEAASEAVSTDENLPLSGEHYIFGINATFAPFEYVDGTDDEGNEVLAGLDIDLVEKLSEKLGFTYEFSDMEFSGLIGAISSGRCDVIVSGISINDERDEVVDATEPYFMPKISILSYEDNEFTDVESLEGHTCGVSLGTVYDSICTDNGSIDVKTYDSTANAFQDLQNGNIEACMFDATQAQKFIDDNPDLGLVRDILPDSYCEDYEVQGYVVLVPEGETELVELFDQAIDELQEDGTMDELITKWCGAEYLEN